MSCNRYTCVLAALGLAGPVVILPTFCAYITMCFANRALYVVAAPTEYLLTGDTITTTYAVNKFDTLGLHLTNTYDHLVTSAIISKNAEYPSLHKQHENEELKRQYELNCAEMALIEAEILAGTLTRDRLHHIQQQVRK